MRSLKKHQFLRRLLQQFNYVIELYSALNLFNNKIIYVCLLHTTKMCFATVQCVAMLNVNIYEMSLNVYAD